MTGRYEVRRARASEVGRWVICQAGLPYAVVGNGYLTGWGVKRVARRWNAQNEAAKRMESV